MSIIVTERFPCGNVRVLENRGGAEPEIVFSADPRGREEALWFYFKLRDPAPAASHPAELRLTLLFFPTLHGAGDPSACRPVFRIDGKNWERLRPPRITEDPSGLSRLTWPVPYPAVETEFAFTLPYANRDLQAFLGHCNGYWTESDIGLTAAGRPLGRLANPVKNGQTACPNPHGLYVLARRTAGEAPGSWVLEGLLEAVSRVRPVNWCVRAIPFASLDDAIAGLFSRDGGPGGREELLIRQDIERWAGLCKPELVLDLRAASASTTGAVRGILLPSGEALDKSAKAWCNTFANALQPDYGGADFAQEGAGDSDALQTFVTGKLQCPFLPVLMPYAVLNGQTLMQKQYREIGRLLAKAVLGRW